MKKGKKKLFVIVPIILVLAVAAYAFENNVWGIKDGFNSISPFNSRPVSYSPVPLRELNQNPFNYIGKYIVVRGKLYLGEFQRINVELVDDAGYHILLDKNCFDAKRQYTYADSSSNPTYYTAQGLFTSENLVSCTSYIQ
jgi:hypothetical protein